eukprot:CAMPEP_0182830626 /NCGR_PEP_ID=MMETSP0006_2-20121128/18679_1 /TAXON_ID=97485 /ORGANISM="Prymnesium parvum, Strain Texoma1" /LENGTH=127 /DNA_ID=CAMNT_0024958213 /DNA_START=200 /DNA_END=579 /DNA_ORIENTATION=-
MFFDVPTVVDLRTSWPAQQVLEWYQRNAERRVGSDSSLSRSIKHGIERAVSVRPPRRLAPASSTSTSSRRACASSAAPPAAGSRPPRWTECRFVTPRRLQDVLGEHPQRFLKEWASVVAARREQRVL